MANFPSEEASLELVVPLLFVFIGICIYVGWYDALRDWRERRVPMQLLFAAMCFLAALYGVNAGLGYRADSHTDYLAYLKWMSGLGHVFWLACLWVVADFTRSRPLPVLWALSTVHAVLLITNGVLPYGIAYSDQVELARLMLPWGESVSVLPADPSGWLMVDGLATWVTLIFLAYAGVRQYHRGERRTAAYLLAAITVFAVTLAHDTFVAFGTWDFVNLAAFGFLALVVVMSQGLRETMSRRNRQLRAIIDRSPAIICVKDLEGRYQLVNQQYEKLFGVTNAAMLDKTDHDLFPKVVADRFRANDRQVLVSDQAEEFEEVAEVNGDPHTYVSLKFPLHSGGAEPYAVCAISTDISERKHVDEALVKGEARYRRLVESAQAIPWEVDLATWRFTYVGPQAEKLLGYPVEAWYQQEFWSEHIHPDDRDWAMRFCVEASGRGEDHQFEYRLLAADGRVVWIRDDVSVVSDDTGPVLLQGYMYDITARRRTEEAIKNIAAGVSAQTGEAFFHQLVLHLARLFDADYAFIGLLPEDQPGVVETYAVCAHGQIADNMSYHLTDTPCANVVGQRTCAHPRGVQQEFPKDQVLMDMGVESYIGTPLFDTEGQPLGLIVVLDSKPMEDTSQVADILEIFAARAGAELERLRTVQDLFLKERAMEAASEGIVLTDLSANDNPIIYVNPAMEVITGYSEAELLGCNPRLLQGPDTDPDAVSQLSEAVTQRRPCKVEILNYRKDGTPFWNLVTITPVQAGAGAITHFIGTQIDVTESHRAQEMIRKLSRAVEQSPSAILITDAEGSIEYVNPAFTKVTGYTAGEVTGKSPAILGSGETTAETYANLWRSIKTGQTWAGEFRNRRRDGSRYWDFTVISPIKNADGEITHFLGIQSDITERKRLETELRDHRDHLEQLVAKRTAELTRVNKELEAFSYSVSHDLRAPLRSIDGFSQALLDDCSDVLDETGKGYLHRVRNASQRMAALIDDLLELSRVGRQNVHPEMVDLSGLVREIAARLRESAPERMVEIDIEDGLRIQCDQRLLGVALDNLLGNAWKYTSKNDLTRIAFGATERDGEQVYFVRDNGVGFDMQYASKLFGAFQRLHKVEEFEGTGIGLATVERIMHRHGGQVWAEAQPGEGATFYFTLGAQAQISAA